jgi:transcription elongation factor Elf1
MAEVTSKTSHKAKKQEMGEVTFKCWRCEEEKPISEMKIITRFRPVMVVCEDCEKELR